jgi:hypothetical protein
MKTSCRLVLSSGAILLLIGCRGSQSSIGMPGAMPSNFMDAVRRSKTFNYTGKPQRFKVPPSVTKATVIADGAAGAGTPNSYGPPGGLGGRVYAVVPVQPNETLYVYVGGAANGSNGGFNGGASGEYLSYGGSFGGGGASDVREGGQKLTDRVIVAGAGGGAGGSAYSGGAGAGGEGGSRVGGRGGGGDYNSSGDGGRGGTQTHGGKGGKAGAGSYGYGRHGKAGTLGLGGDGGGMCRSESCEPGGGGGGGGGGYYGGGGGGSGGAQTSHQGNGGGGGGGSSYVESSAKGVRMYRGWKDASGNGTVTIKWS